MPTGRSEQSNTLMITTSHDEMAHWPATVGVERMRRAWETIALTGTQEERDENNPQLARDRVMLQMSHRAARYGLEEMKKLSEFKDEPERVMRATIDLAQRADTDDTIGLLVTRTAPDVGPGLMSIRVAAIPRDPDWIGASGWHPQMRDSLVMINESDKSPGRTGWVHAVPEEDEFPMPDVQFPPGDPNLLRCIILWHGAKDVRWMPRDRGRGRDRRTPPVRPREPALV